MPLLLTVSPDEQSVAAAAANQFTVPANTHHPAQEHMGKPPASNNHLQIAHSTTDKTYILFSIYPLKYYWTKNQSNNM